MGEEAVGVAAESLLEFAGFVVGAPDEGACERLEERVIFEEFLPAGDWPLALAYEGELHSCGLAFEGFAD